MSHRAALGEEGGNDPSATPVGSGRSKVPGFIRLVLALVPTANALLLIVQATLAEPPLSTILPGWVYVVTNVAVVAGAGIARVIAVLVSDPIIGDYLDADASADNSSESGGHEA